VDDASQRLGYSRRAIQGALRQLVDEGLCRSSRDGRHVEYALEDSTFSGLTRSRFSPST
jgi:DNA-binding transcriptional regulator PaaX